MIVNEGLICLLNDLLNGSSYGLKIKLFINNITPDANTVLGDLTEASFAGYSFISIPSVAYPAPTINGSGQAESDSGTLNWTCTSSPGSPQTVYGLYVIMEDTSALKKLLFAAAFDTPVVITTSGDEVNKKLNWYAADLPI